ncbi:hypothetical protein CROQUDRAFT_726039 [Cronartium quercuum f. sp. fusiforme G11]|uniref:CN hydrolase domain-containing protein n=1 Tax=Cronartium quercuum f. sp. fusiforme G11 TaxID=708437 RepID=A0A9P6NB78_9BASI|nr:hypothetical protein CROQUDRAFT_726039 [Cronartium quercuum f. sp. fusiforme G11]
MARSTTIALLQLEPVFKEPLATIDQAEGLIADLRPGQVDLLMLPELAFAGYNFQSYQEIEPFVESEIDGISVSWARATATRLNCHVIIGFAQRIQPSKTKPNLIEQKCYNALAIVSNVGELLTVYHKTQLYPAVDPLWAKAGEGFLRIDLQIGRAHDGAREAVKCCVGICMDLSPDKFEAPFDAYELSSFVVQQDAEILLCSMAWLDSGPWPNPDQTRSGKSWEEVSGSINYWAGRCTPMWKKHGQTFVACNRVGREQDTVYTGTSCVISNVTETLDSKPPERPTVLAYASNLNTFEREM